MKFELVKSTYDNFYKLYFFKKHYFQGGIDFRAIFYLCNIILDTRSRGREYG